VLQIPRAVARTLRGVLRRCLFDGSSRNDWPFVRVRADGQQLILESARGPIALRYTMPDASGSGSLAFRSSVLSAFEGRSNAPVNLEAITATQGRARWEDAGVPHEHTVETVAANSLPEMPELPTNLVAMPEGFLEALAEAALSTAAHGTRYALERVQLGGPDGALIATDGKQVLIQRNYPLAWTDRILVPRLRLSGLPGVADQAPVLLGRTNSHIVVQSGSWSFFLTIDDQGKYPDVLGALPRPASITSRCQIAAEDVGRLIEVLPKLPGHDQDLKPLTVDLGDTITVRGRALPSGAGAEIVLPKSQLSGRPVRFATPRELLLRDLRMGLTQLEITRADGVIVTRDSTRIFGWMPLETSAVVLPEQSMIRVHRPSATLAPSSESASQPVVSEPRSIAMPSLSTNGHPSDDRRAEANGAFAGIDELLNEAESLRQHLSEAASRATRLVAALKQHRRQARAVEAAVTSIRDLRLGSR
jgi:hypothetical protein